MLLLSPLFMSVATMLALQSHSQPASLPSDASLTNPHVVTIVRVKAPWYAFDFLLAREFRKAVPAYQSVTGLRFKAFSSINTDNGKFFGGIYLWASTADAHQWYSPIWAAEVEKKRGGKPIVAYFSVVNDTTFVTSQFDYRRQENETVTVFVHGISPQLAEQCQTKQPGLWRTYIVTDADSGRGAILLFASASDAKSFLRQQTGSRTDWYKTPVLLNNVR